MTPLVSVPIPAYNAANFIRSSLDSAFSQTLDDIEAIVVNDGSTDDMAYRVAACKDPRLCVITQTNGGLASALNAAIRAAWKGTGTRSSVVGKSLPNTEIGETWRELGLTGWIAPRKLVIPITVSGGAFAWMGGPEGMTFGVCSPAKGIHEGFLR